MPELQKIDIDLDIHKLIEAERRSFDEPPYVALRRLLKLSPPAAPSPTTKISDFSLGLPWIDDGVTIPHGSLAKMEYGRRGQIYEGKFLDGCLVVNGKSFRTLSAAASAVAITTNGKKTSLNGWLYWKAQFPGETNWRSLEEMRQHKRL